MRRFEITTIAKRGKTPTIGASPGVIPGSSTKVQLAPITNGQPPAEERSTANLAVRPSKPQVGRARVSSIDMQDGSSVKVKKNASIGNDPISLILNQQNMIDPLALVKLNKQNNALK